MVEEDAQENKNDNNLPSESPRWLAINDDSVGAIIAWSTMNTWKNKKAETKRNDTNNKNTKTTTNKTTRSTKKPSNMHELVVEMKKLLMMLMHFR